jgi:hypothetical protein
MKVTRLLCIQCGLLLWLAIGAFSQEKLSPCSTQKVNGDCTLVFDRLDPVSLPTIQMRKDARIKVCVVDPLPYESLSLDPVSFVATAPTDQTQGFVAALLPSLKGVSTPAVTPRAALLRQPSDSADVTKVKQELAKLGSYLDNPFPTLQTFVENAEGFYAQIEEAVAPLPRARMRNAKLQVRPAGVPKGTPYPWAAPYRDWVSLVLCELSAADCQQDENASFRDLMVTGVTVQTLLTPPTAPTGSTGSTGSTGPPPVAPLRFNNAQFDALAATTDADIRALSPAERTVYAAELASLRAREAALITATPTYAAAWLPGVTAINKDLQTYFVNLKETASAQPENEISIGYIDDPHSLSKPAATATRLLGRVVSYSINAVNQVGVMTTAVPTTAQKSAVVTISVLYADPIFEVSTGALFSFMPNRTFANQTLVNTNTGGIPATGDIIITRSLTRPIVLPYVAANFRLGHDFLVGSRRSAAYFTTAVAFNGYNTTAEYAVGPSFSWRMIMISPLMHIGHDTHLTQGESVGEIWCNTAAAAGSADACVGSPPAPSSKYFWRVAFALGIGIRVPTSFGTITGH